MEKHQSSYEDILFIHFIHMEFRRYVLHSLLHATAHGHSISHTAHGVSPHTPYIVTYRPTPCDVSTHHMIVCYVHPQ